MILRLILLAPVLLVLVLFGLSNRHEEVQVRLWPFDLAWVTSLSLAVLAFAALTFLLGALVAWVASLPTRRRARRAESAARQLESELAEYRGRAAQQVGPVPPRPGTVDLPRLARPVA